MRVGPIEIGRLVTHVGAVLGAVEEKRHHHPSARIVLRQHGDAVVAALDRAGGPERVDRDAPRADAEHQRAEDGGGHAIRPRGQGKAHRQHRLDRGQKHDGVDRAHDRDQQIARRDRAQDGARDAQRVHAADGASGGGRIDIDSHLGEEGRHRADEDGRHQEEQRGQAEHAEERGRQRGIAAHRPEEGQGDQRGQSRHAQ